MFYHRVLDMTDKINIKNFDRKGFLSWMISHGETEERGIRIMGPVMQIFDGQRSQVRVYLEKHEYNE